MDVLATEDTLVALVDGLASLKSIISERTLAKCYLPQLADLVKGNIVPAYDSAMYSGGFLANYNSAELGDAMACMYISGNSVPRDSVVADRIHQVNESKFYLATWQNKPLGWMKLVENRWNNLIPSIARVSITDHP